MRKNLVKNFAYNTMYQILVLITPLITTPYVSRVLGVTNIGNYQYCQSIAGYFVLIANVGTSIYGQREIAYLQDNREKYSIAFWEIELFRVAATFICVIAYFFVFCIDSKNSNIYTILMIEVVATAFDISWFFMGLEYFKITVIRNTIIKITGVISVFVFVRDKEDLWLYTLCVTAPIFIGNISLWFSVNKYLAKTGITLLDIIYGISKRIKSIFALFLPQIAADIYLLLDKTMIGIMGSNIDEVGYYSQGQKIIKLILMIVTSLGTVMLPAMSAMFIKKDYEGIKQHIQTAFKFIYLLSFPMLFGICAVAPRFVPAFFGDGYQPVIKLMIVISPILVIIATSNVIGKQFLLPTNQQKAFTISIITGACTNFVFNLALIPLLDAVGASIATVIAELMVAFVQYMYARKQLPLKQFIFGGAKYFFMGLIMFLCCKGIDLLLPVNNIIGLLIEIVVGVCVYFIELLVFRDSMVINILEKIKKKII